MRKRITNLSKQQWKDLAETAWSCRERSFVVGNTKVGAAVLSEEGRIFAGCNVEHPFRSHDVHAEVNAITSMIANGSTRMVAIIIVAERKRFTPCGACMDWIFQFGCASCIVGYQSRREGKIKIFRAKHLMPHYPM